ncbi:MAG TPA: Fis family transcriptional regulator [Syntrophaceae bacterium]|jgi:PAS domain S-box-containing protein|nr:Fis family transcriptional regulator [Syntrophaceae bacterium]
MISDIKKRKPKTNLQTKQQLLVEVEELRTRLDATERRLQEANEILQVQITERKRAEEAFEKAQEYTESIVDTIREPLIVLTSDLKVISANRSFYETFQVAPEETEGILIFDVCNHQWDIPALRELLEKIVPQNTHFNNFEVDHAFPHIGRKRVLLNARRIYRKGKGTDRILLAFEDITDQKQTEEALKSSEKRYRRLFESAQDGILILDAETGQISDVNPFLVEMLGYSHEDFLGKKLWEIGVFKDIEASKTAFLELQGKGYVRYNDLPLETQDGRPMAVEFVSNVYLVNDHKVIQCNIRDITERKLIGEALQRAHNELEQKVEERTVELSEALSKIITMKDRLEAENIYFREERRTRGRFDNIIGQSDGLKYVLYRAEQVASMNTTVLILGETGTGKDLIATAIHNMSPRKKRALITVNCAALPGNLIESELFGREKGAFTGADIRRVGRFEIANGSTICLDEIGELPMELQVKLLRVIQHNEFERLGSSHTVKVDVRIIATTNRDLEEEVRKGRFRQDLYYRLNIFPITIPPLRQRKDDIPLMVQAFIDRYSRKLGKEITSIPKETMKKLQDYQWPGNVRELESIIERAVILCPGPVLQLTDKLEISSPQLSSAVRTLEETERNHILKILSETRWCIEGKDCAAAILGLHPSTLRARMQKLGIVRSKTKE